MSKPQQCDAYTGLPIDPVAVPAGTPLPDAGYDRLTPGPIGAGHEIYWLRQTVNGCEMIHAGRKQEGDQTPDLRQQYLREMYARLKRERIPRAAAGAAITSPPTPSTTENTDNGC